MGGRPGGLGRASGGLAPRDGPGSPLAALDEPDWWDGDRPLLDLLGEMYAAVARASAAFLRQQGPERDGAGEAAAKGPGKAPGPAPVSEGEGRPDGDGASPPEGPEAGTAPRVEAPKARPLMLPGLAEALGVDPAAAVARGRRRR